MKHTEKLTSYDGIDTLLHFDENEGKLIVQNTADVSSLVDRNTEYRNDGLGRGKDMRMVASIPLHMLFELQELWAAQGIDPKDGMKKFLNDPDMRAFRTSNERI